MGFTSNGKSMSIVSNPFGYFDIEQSLSNIRKSKSLRELTTLIKLRVLKSIYFFKIRVASLISYTFLYSICSVYFLFMLLKKVVYFITDA